jgi:ribosomal protein L37AE/L43A
MSHVRTIWRGFQADQEVWECRSCGVTVTRAATNAGPQARSAADSRVSIVDQDSKD